MPGGQLAEIAEVVCDGHFTVFQQTTPLPWMQAVRQLGLEGVLVLEAIPETPAYKAGIRSTYRDQAGRLVLGDIITALNGKPVCDFACAAEYLMPSAT